MAEAIVQGFSKADLLLVVGKLRKLYGDLHGLQPTLDGRGVYGLYPLLRVGGRSIGGFPIDESRFSFVEVLPHRRRVLSADAGAKVLFDIGTFKVVEAKVIAGVWRGLRKLGVFGPYKRLALVASREEAAEWLLRIEVEMLLKLSRYVGTNDYVLLDRSLAAPPVLGRGTRGLLGKLDEMVSARGGILVGVTKASRLSLNTGESLIGYLLRLGDRFSRGLPWYYYPIFRQGSLPAWMLGDIAVAKLSDSGENAFRIDISFKSLRERRVGDIIGELAHVQDGAVPGYPYPLKAVHDLSRISDSELEIDRMLFLELLRGERILEEFVADVRSSDFRQRYLWGDGI